MVKLSLPIILTGLIIFFLGLTIGQQLHEQPDLISPIPEEQVISCQLRQPLYGQVSWYSAKYDGINCDDPDCIMANGKKYDPQALTTACSKDFPLGTQFIVKYQGKIIPVICTDRGIFKERYDRILDLSEAAFKKLAPLEKGVIWVVIEVQ